MAPAFTVGVPLTYSNSSRYSLNESLKGDESFLVKVSNLENLHRLNRRLTVTVT